MVQANSTAFSNFYLNIYKKNTKLFQVNKLGQYSIYSIMHTHANMSM